MDEKQWLINVIKQIVLSAKPDNEKVSLIKQLLESYEEMKGI